VHEGESGEEKRKFRPQEEIENVLVPQCVVRQLQVPAVTRD
jgi:hypothetical protein